MAATPRLKRNELMENLLKPNGTSHLRPDKDAVKAATDLIELVREYGVRLTRKGSGWKGLFHFYRGEHR